MAAPHPEARATVMGCCCQGTAFGDCADQNDAQLTVGAAKPTAGFQRGWAVPPVLDVCHDRIASTTFSARAGNRGQLYE
jgi:hypothetical protein